MDGLRKKTRIFTKRCSKRDFVGIQERNISGFNGIHLLRRDQETEVEFITIHVVDTLEAVRSFAGEDYEVAVVPPKARAVLKRFDGRSQHYEVKAHRTAPLRRQIDQFILSWHEIYNDPIPIAIPLILHGLANLGGAVAFTGKPRLDSRRNLYNFTQVHMHSTIAGSGGVIWLLSALVLVIAGWQQSSRRTAG